MTFLFGMEMSQDDPKSKLRKEISSARGIGIKKGHIYVWMKIHLTFGHDFSEQMMPKSTNFDMVFNTKCM